MVALAKSIEDEKTHEAVLIAVGSLALLEVGAGGMGFRATAAALKAAQDNILVAVMLDMAAKNGAVNLWEGQP